MKPRLLQDISRIVLPYVLFAGLWILLSDQVLESLTSDPSTLVQWSIYKGWVFVLVTALLLSALLRVELQSRGRAESDLRRANRALRTTSECNQLLVRATDERTLLDGVCRLLVEHGGYRMAWVGFAEKDDARTVRPVAQAGFDAGYLDTVNITWADNERGRGPTGTAIRTGRPVIARNIPTDPAYGPWRAAAIQRGYASSVALPLVSEGHTLGALMAYAAEPDAFDATEAALLAELAGDLAYGLTALRTRVARDRAEKALREQQQFLAALLDNIGEAVVSCDTEGRLARFNRAARELHGLPEQPIPPEQWAEHYDLYEANGQTPLRKERIPLFRALQGETVRGFELVVAPKHGPPRPQIASGQPLRDAAGRITGAVASMHDITARQQSESALRQERDFSNAALDSLPGVFYCYDENRKFRRWNKNFERVTGYSGEAIARMSPLDFFAGAEKDLLAERIQKVFDQGEAAVEADFVSKDGTRTPYYFTGLTTMIEGRRHLVGVGIDITERKRAEEALRASHARLKKVLEVETVGVMFWDLASGCMTDANDTFLNLMGYSRRDVEAGELTWQKLTPPEYLEASLAEIQKFQATGRVGPYEKEYLRKDGTRLWFVFAGSSLGHNACVEFCVDISARKQAEAGMAESEERLRLALDAAHLGTFDWDLPANRITWSRWHEELWGFKPGEFSGTYEAFSSRVHPDDLPGINAEVARCIAQREPFTREFRVVWPDGGVHWIAGRGEFSFNATGQPMRMRGAVKEITERKQAEQSLHELTGRLLRLQDEERRRIARELHDTTAQHLAALTLGLAALRQEPRPDMDERQAGVLESCVTLARQSADELRTLSYLLHPPLLDDFGLARAVPDFVEGFSRRSGIRAELEISARFPRLDRESELALFRVLQEALSNVHRHSGSATVVVRLVETAGEVRLEVQDAGRGLPGEGASLRGVQVGVGLLGMRERMQQLGGRLEVNSGLPGTRILATLPVEQRSYEEGENSDRG